MHQWPGGKATQKVVVYPIPRPSWETKIDGAQTNENAQEYLHHPENDVVEMADQQIKTSSCFIQVDNPQKKLNEKDVNALKEQLDAQLKVNADLKKLLIASLGDDLQCKVDVLVRTKAHLTNEVSSYSNKMLEDFENIDKLTVETNLWRTKFQASCVLLNLLTSEKNKMEESFLRSQNSLQTLLDERRQINGILLQTNNHLNGIHSTLFPFKQHHHLSDAEPGNTVELAESNSSLVETIYDLLHGDRRSTADLPSPSKRLTFAEALATEVLSNKSETTTPSGSDICSIVRSSKTFIGTTFNCCRKCKGQIMNV